jgi:mRNA interferase MazF
MKVSRGDVVLADFPFTSGTAQKLRPAVVVQNDLYNRRLDTTILAPVTSNTRHVGDPAQVLVDPTTPDGAPTGLLMTSAIKCENLATIETRLVRRRIGVASAALLTQLDAALKVSLALS